jgi:hypothetical protein
MLCSICNKDLDNGEHWRCQRCSCTGCGETSRSKKDRSLCQWCVDDLERRGERRCRACNAIKPLSEFYTPPRSCRECVCAWRRQRYREDPTPILLKRRSYYQQNREKAIARHRAYYQRNKERMKQAAKVRYARSPRSQERNRVRKQAWLRKPENQQRMREARQRYRLRKKLKVLEEIRGKR